MTIDADECEQLIALARPRPMPRDSWTTPRCTPARPLSRARNGSRRHGCGSARSWAR